MRNPRVVVLDEATSALDTQSEQVRIVLLTLFGFQAVGLLKLYDSVLQVVREALLTSAKGRTSITIAHRLDTIRYCGEL